MLGALQPMQFKTLACYEETLSAETTRRDYRGEPEDLLYRTIRRGDAWGRSGVTTWFTLDVNVPQANAYVSLVYSASDKARGEQILVFENNKPIGVLDRNHGHVRLSGVGSIRLGLEAYPFHTVPGNQPYETGRIVSDYTRVFQAVTISALREDVRRFLCDARALMELYEALPEHDLFRYEILRAMEKVFITFEAAPDGWDDDRLEAQARKGVEILGACMTARNGSFTPYAGLTAHAHIDTAWQWDIDETVRKCARTFSSVLNLMRCYPGFSFIQSQPYQLERMREYPDIYEEVKQRVGDGRWELNGGMYVEPDLNIPSGESLARQLLYGQLSTRDNFGISSDTLWAPDTFGFPASLPQLMRSAGLSYFSTGKLRGNDTTRFPFDVFIWRGLDGTEALAHFSKIESGPGPQSLLKEWNDVQHKDAQRSILVAFGHGDGGGGPTEAMLEEADRVADLQGCPRGAFTTVSRFMQGIDWDGLPRYDGELYFQAHRGTYTSIGAIKRWNRRLEFRFQEAEYHLTRSALARRAYPRAEMDALWKRFLVCQFHDILPGTAIESVNRAAVAEMEEIYSQLGALMDIPAPKNTVVLHNSTGVARTGVNHMALPDGRYPISDGVNTQVYSDLDQNACVALLGLSIPPLSGRAMRLSQTAPRHTASSFHYTQDRLETPWADIAFAEDGSISSFQLHALPEGNRELAAANGRLNQFWLGEDVPHAWDNWDIDYEQRLKMKPGARLISREAASDGAVEFRVRSEYKLGARSTLWQDMVFHADRPQIDFDCKLEWHDKRILLKAVFNTAIRAQNARHEIQFGHVTRPNHANTKEDQAQFEVCNHKWTNLSQADRGVSILNNGKYGVSVEGGRMALTLVKSSVHPDTRGDEGVQRFTYALLAHSDGFNPETILPAAYALNAPLTAVGAYEDVKPLLRIDAPNVVIEAVKMAQREHALVARLYESAGGSASGVLRTDFSFKQAFETNLLEERILEMNANSIIFSFHPFEVKTVMFIL